MNGNKELYKKAAANVLSRCKSKLTVSCFLAAADDALAGIRKISHNPKELDLVTVGFCGLTGLMIVVLPIPAVASILCIGAGGIAGAFFADFEKELQKITSSLAANDPDLPNATISADQQNKPKL